MNLNHNKPTGSLKHLILQLLGKLRTQQELYPIIYYKKNEFRKTGQKSNYRAI